MAAMAKAARVSGYVRPTPLAVRLPRDLIDWLSERRANTGVPVNRMIAHAVSLYRDSVMTSEGVSNDNATDCR